MTKAWLAIAAIGVAGCASAPPSPQAVRFAELQAPVKAAFVDLRVEADRQTRSGRMGDVQFHYMGDGSMQPSAVELAVAVVAEALPEKLRGASIEVQRVEVGFWRAKGASSAGGSAPFMIIPGAPIAAMVLGNLIGQGIASAMAPTQPGFGKGYPFAGAVFELRVGEQRVASYDNVVIDGSVSAEMALERAVSSGLSTLRQKAAELVAPIGRGS
jgi:hypothetical protein